MKKNQKKLIVIIAVIIVAVSSFVGYISFAIAKGLNNSDTDNEKRYYEVEEYLLEREKKFHKALKESLKWYMENDSALWNSAFVKTEEYERIKNLIGDECEEFNANEEVK